MNKIVGITVGTPQNPKKITNGYVPETRKIAGIDLKDDITVKELMENLSINQKLDYKVLTPPATEMHMFYEYLGTLAEENWISLWEETLYINLKFKDAKYRQFKLFANNTIFHIRARTGTKNEQGEIEWSNWGGGRSDYTPCYTLNSDSLNSLFIQYFNTPKIIGGEQDRQYYPVVAQSFVKVTVPQTDKTTGTEILPIGDYFMVGSVANDQIGCWSLTDNQSYTITRTKDESGAWHYQATSSKSYIDEKIGDIDTALDELHAYAQGLISGGDEV